MAQFLDETPGRQHILLIMDCDIIEGFLPW